MNHGGVRSQNETHIFDTDPGGKRRRSNCPNLNQPGASRNSCHSNGGYCNASRPTTAKPATTAAAAAKSAETKPDPPKHPADEDDEGNPIYHPEAPALVADIHCGEVSKTCTIKLPKDIPPTDAKW